MRPRATLGKPAILTRRLFALLVRSAVIGSMSFAVSFGFISGATSPRAHYDPQMFAIGVAALLGAACGAIGILISRIRQMKAELRDLEAHVDKEADRNWEMREAQERSKSFFEAQGDVIVRRDGAGAVTYANDAFCALAGRPREDLLATTFRLPVEEQGETRVLADGTRVHDQKIAAAAGARWIAWREVTVRDDGGSEIQSVGRDMTDRVLAGRALAEARDQAEAANRAKSRFLANDDVALRLEKALAALLRLAHLPIAIRFLVDARLQIAQLRLHLPDAGNEDADGAARGAEKRRHPDREHLRIVVGLRRGRAGDKAEGDGKRHRSDDRRTNEEGEQPVSENGGFSEGGAWAHGPCPAPVRRLHRVVAGRGGVLL